VLGLRHRGQARQRRVRPEHHPRAHQREAVRGRVEQPAQIVVARLVGDRPLHGCGAPSEISERGVVRTAAPGYPSHRRDRSRPLPGGPGGPWTRAPNSPTGRARERVTSRPRAGLERRLVVAVADRAAAARRLEWLVDEIRRHDVLYHLRDRPEISDAQYDRLFAELLELGRDWPELRRPDPPTQHVGAPGGEAGARAAGFAPFEHRVPMLSLDNAMDEDEFRAFDERMHRLLEPDAPIEYAGELKL